MDDGAKAWFDKGTLADYLGLPVINQASTVVNDVRVSALPFRAYQLIYNEYFRDQNLQNAVNVSTEGGEDTDFTQLVLQSRCWEKDYFTSCLPFAQRGGDVVMPFEPQYKDEGEFYESDGTTAADRDWETPTE